MFLIAEYYTNIDTSEWDSEDGRAMIFDYMTRCGDELTSRYDKMCGNESFVNDLHIIETIYLAMCDALTQRHEFTSSPAYKIGKVMDTVTENMDILSHLPDDHESMEKLIDVMGMLRKKDSANDTASALPGTLSFAKR